MATPADHYLAAEKLIGQLREQAAPDATVTAVAAVAQVHATLAAVGAAFLHGQGGVYPTACDELADAITPAVTP